MNLVDEKLGASTLSERDKWRKSLDEWRINTDRHRIYAHRVNLSLLSPLLDDIVALIKGFDAIRT